MNYVENVAAFIQFCLENEEELPCFDKGFDGAEKGALHLFNYCDEPAYDMNLLVLDVCKHLGKPKKRLFHFPFALAYLGGKCFDLAALILHRKFAINSICVKKFTQNTYFRSTRVPGTGSRRRLNWKKACAARLITSLLRRRKDTFSTASR